MNDSASHGDSCYSAVQAIRSAVIRGQATYWAADSDDKYSPDAETDKIAAAVLRALVDEELPKESAPSPGRQQPGGTRMYYHEASRRWEERRHTRSRILAIADRIDPQEETS